MPDLNQQFVRDPHFFARTRALYPWPSPTLVLNPDHFKSRALEAENDLDQVQGENKVCYGDIVPAMGLRGLTGDFAEDYSHDAGLYVMQITNNSTTATSFPVYYLPFGPNRTIRMKLKPSRKHTRMSTGGAVIDPDVFVTVALQGCSIFVDGSPDEPVVYHVNVADFGGVIAPDAPERETRRLVAAKEQEMRRRHALAQRQYRKEGPSARQHAPAVPGHHAEVGMSSYMPDMLTPQRRAALTTQHSRTWRTLWGWAGGWNPATSQVGTVFGVRTAGLWAFYRQTRVRVMYDVPVPDEAPYGPPRVERTVFWAGVNCVQFWPTAG